MPEETSVKDVKSEVPAEKAKEEANAEAAKQKETNSEAAQAKEPEEDKEKEEDAAVDSRPKVATGSVRIRADDATLNAVSSSNGKLLMTLKEGGFQYLLAGARSNTGLVAGRYMFEVRIVESLAPWQAPGSQVPQPLELVRVGLSTAGSSVLLGDGSDNISFDSEGFFLHEKVRKKVAQKFSAGETVAVVVNLDAGSVNANTISLFKNGTRVAEPQAIPESLKGKALYPTVTYRNVTLQVNFAGAGLAKLPFSCRTVGDAASADVEVAPVSKPAAGKHEVLFPVGLPAQGYFDWVDVFVKNHPEYTELSDRKILEWASKSGLSKANTGGSHDKPDMKFGLSAMDDGSVSRIIKVIAPTLSRNFIIPQMKSNFVAAERKAAFDSFKDFKRSAVVVMGEPTSAHKQNVQDLILTGKQAAAEAAKKKKHAEATRNKLLAERKKKAEEAKRDRLRAQGKEVEEPAEEPAEDTPMEEDTPVELTEEEKNTWYIKTSRPDVSKAELAKSFTKFALPSREEGFDEVKYEWEGEAACSEKLKTYILDMKLTTRVDDLKPGEAFKDQLSKWQKQVAAWKQTAAVWKDPVKRKAAAAKKKADAKKKKEEERKALGEEAPAEEEAEEEKEPMEIDADDVDALTVEDVTDIGSGEPLFAKFEFEDWALMSLRYELHLLVHSFKKDLDDQDRPSFGEDHLSFYYNLYFRKQFNLKFYVVENLKDLLEHIKEAILINDKTMLEALLAEDVALDIFVKHTEEYRRERTRRLDAGDETAALKFNRAAGQPQQPTGRPQQPTGRPQQPTRPQQPMGRPSGGAAAAGNKRPMFNAAAAGPSKHYGGGVYGGGGYRR